MRTILIVAAIINLAAPAAAATCTNSVGKDRLSTADYQHFTWSKPGRRTLNCFAEDDHQPHGPYAVTCSGDGRSVSTWINYVAGKVQFQNIVWACKP